MTRDAVTSDQLPASGLPFSVAVRGGGLLFLSGQVAQDPATGELVDGDIAQQADQILRNRRNHPRRIRHAHPRGVTGIRTRCVADSPNNHKNRPPDVRGAPTPSTPARIAPGRRVSGTGGTVSPTVDRWG